jgi:hypothetical protein
VNTTTVTVNTILYPVPERLPESDAQVGEGEHREEREQQRAQGARRAEVVVDEGVAVQQEQHGDRRVVRTAAGHDVGLGEDLHRRDDLQQQQDQQHEPGLRDRHVAQALHHGRAVQLGRLVQLAGDRLQRRQVDQRRRAEVRPRRHQHQRQQRGRAVVEPARPVDPDGPQDRVEQAGTGVVEPLPQQRRHHRREHHRQVDDQPEVPLGVPELVEQDGDQERDEEPEHQRQPGEQQRVGPGVPEQRVREEPLEVLEADPLGIGDEVDLLERQQHTADDGVPGEQREADQRGAQEPVRRQVLHDPAAHPAGGPPP